MTETAATYIPQRPQEVRARLLTSGDRRPQRGVSPESTLFSELSIIIYARNLTYVFCDTISLVYFATQSVSQMSFVADFYLLTFNVRRS